MLNEQTSIDKHFHHYRIRTEISNSTFCSVYHAEHILQTSQVTLTIFHTSPLSPLLRHQFLLEVQPLKRIHHAHIRPILDAGFYEDIPYIITEFTPASTLREHMRLHTAQRWPVQKTLSLLIQIGQALHYTHQRNIVHGNLTPEHLLLNDDGHITLTDFRIALLQDQFDREHEPLTAMLPYMAPEQFAGKLYKASDQYALGCIAYELLTGQVPFPADSLSAFQHKHTLEKPIAPTQYNLLLPIPLEEVILKSLAKNSSERFPSLKDFVACLEKYMPAGPSHGAKSPPIATAVAVLRSPIFSPNPSTHVPKAASGLKEKVALLLPAIPPTLPVPSLLQEQPTVVLSIPAYRRLSAPAEVSASPAIEAQPTTRTKPTPSPEPPGRSIVGGNINEYLHRPEKQNRANSWVLFLGLGLATTAIILSLLFLLLPAAIKSPLQSITHTHTVVPTATTNPGLTPTTKLEPTASAPLADKLAPAITPTPTATSFPTPPPPTSTTFSVTPTSFQLGADCIKQNDHYTCLATLQLPQSFQGTLKWSVMGSGAITSFTPTRGTLMSGQEQLVTISLLSACPHAGILIFSSKNGTVAVPWSC